MNCELLFRCKIGSYKMKKSRLQNVLYRVGIYYQKLRKTNEKEFRENGEAMFACANGFSFNRFKIATTNEREDKCNKF